MPVSADAYVAQQQTSRNHRHPEDRGLRLDLLCGVVGLVMDELSPREQRRLASELLFVLAATIGRRMAAEFPDCDLSPLFSVRAEWSRAETPVPANDTGKPTASPNEEAR
jgi:hypothetical protein